MPNKHILPPLQRQALLAMLADETGTLTRVPGGYYCPASKAHPVFTVRTINSMERDGLVAFEPPQFPTTITLSNEGRALARKLQETDRAKAGAA